MVDSHYFQTKLIVDAMSDKETSHSDVQGDAGSSKDESGNDINIRAVSQADTRKLNAASQVTRGKPEVK